MGIFKQILGSIGIYKKSSALFVLLALLVVAMLILNRPFGAEEPIEDIPENTAPSEQLNLKYTLSNSGELINERQTRVARAVFDSDADHISLVLIKNNLVTIGSANITLNLPKPTAENNITLEIKSDGVLGQQYVYYKSDTVIEALLSDIAPTSTVSAVITLPKGYLVPSPIGQASSTARKLSTQILIIAALILPLVTFTTLFTMMLRRAQANMNNFAVGKQNTPPDKVAPAVLGVLANGKIGPREMAATLIDLANRGYLHMYRDKETFRFAIPFRLDSEKFKQIRPFEKFLLAKLFEPNKSTSSPTEIGYRIGQHLFSRKITAAMLDMYQQAVLNGYFVTNPAHLHQRYKIIGLSQFAVGLIGFILAGIFGGEYQALLLALFGSVIFSSLIVFGMAPTLPLRTKEGAAVLRQWYGFRKYLSDPTPIEYKGQMEQVYISYLPYAMVLGVEVQWARRFAKAPFKMPEWLDGPTDFTSVEDFANSVYPIVGYIGGLIVQSRVPVVD